MTPSQSEVLTPPLAELDAGPGQRLRRTREEASLSVEEVAARLHLDTRTINNLEADNYEALPAPTFVRGYLRSYARLLNIAAEPIIDGFDRRGLEPPALIADISTSEEAKSTDAPMRIATFAIAAVLLAGVGVWWQSQFDGSWLEGTETTSSEAQEGPQPATPLGASGSDAGERLTPMLRPTDTLPDPGSADAPSGATQIALPRQGPAAGAAGAGDVPTDAAGADGQSTADTAAALAQPADEASTTAPAGPPGVGHVVLRVRRSSWIEVYDRGGERLYYATAKPGDTIDVRGAEPIEVLLGFSPGVRVEYNDQLFDASPYTARGLARFTLGGG